MNGKRQIEMAEMMVTTNNYVAGYAEALVLGTPQGSTGEPRRAEEKSRACRRKTSRGWKVKWSRWNAT